MNPLCDIGHLKDRDGNQMKAPLTKALVCRFARRTRTFERIYKRFATPESMTKSAKASSCTGYELMERLYKICSVIAGAHRSTFDQEKGLFRKIADKDEGAFVEDSVHAGDTGNRFASVTCVNDVDVRVEQCFIMSVPTPPNINLI